MTSPRFRHTATLLGNGKILIAGGGDTDTGVLNTAELFDPISQTFTSLPTMASPRRVHTATMLLNGKVLIAGGHTETGPTNKAELFDPASGSFTSLPPMVSIRRFHTATLLPGGKVLIAGGEADFGYPTNDAELFDPTSETFTAVTPMNKTRYLHSATLLPNGQVLIAGGGQFALGINNTAELFDPASNTFTPAGVMTSPRLKPTATLLPNGQVLIAGGGTDQGQPTNTAELYDPALSRFIPVVAPMTSARTGQTATLLPSGLVLITGGNAGITPVTSAELFDPTSQTFTPSPNTMVSPRNNAHTATLLASGQVLIAGGLTGTGITDAAELFEATATFASLLPNRMTSTLRDLHTETLLPNGKVLIAGGRSSSGTNRAELFDPTTGLFTALPNMIKSRFFHTATLLPTGKVLIAGGFTDLPYPNASHDTPELFDPASNTFTSLAPNFMTARRGRHTATLLHSGKVLIVGGFDGPFLPETGVSAELFDPVSGTFTSLSPNTMSFRRASHTATLLPSGQVLIAGGELAADASITTTWAELFNPASGAFTQIPDTMASARISHTATLLLTGHVLIAGGNTTGGALTNTAELFDPLPRTFTSLPPMTSVRAYHVATLLPNGKVLIAGGTQGAPLIGGATNTAELFDPSSATFTSLSNTMTTPRRFHAATLLPSGKVLIAGGDEMGDSAELFDLSPGISDARRPVLSAVPDTLFQPASLVLSGTGFRGDSEASGGGFNSSATNYPILQLMGLENGQILFPLSNSATNWSDTTFSSETIGAVTPLPNGYYRVTVFTNGIQSFSKIINIALPVQPLSAVSRKMHGAIGAFDINLPLTGNSGIECRTGGASGIHQVVVTFGAPVTLSSATVSSGTGSVSSTTVAGNKVFVNLTGVANAQRIAITLLGVSDGSKSGNVVVPMSVLPGDTTANRAVNSSDIAQTKSRSGQTATASNFRSDVTVNGSINSSDISLVKSKSGTALP